MSASRSAHEKPVRVQPGANARDLVDALREIAQAVGGVLDPPELARLVAERACGLLSADAAAFYLWDDEAEVLRPLFSNDLRAAEPDAPLDSSSPGIAVLSFRRREPIVVDDYAHWEHALPLGRRRGLRASVAVPLQVAGRVVGVLVVRFYSARHYRQEHLQTLALLVGQAAPAFEAARLYVTSETRRQEAEALAALMRRAAAESDPHGVLDLVAESACRLLGADRATVSLLNEDGSARMSTVWGAEWPVGEEVVARGLGIVSRVVAVGHTVVLERIGEDPALPLHQFPVIARLGGRTALGTPLRHQDRVAGVLAAVWKADVKVTGSQVRLIEALGDHAAAALERARLYRAALEEIAERQRAESALRAAERQAIRAEKLRAVGQLASGIAHDLNQSLALITGYGELIGRALEQPTPDLDAVREMSRVVADAAHDGGETLKRLLAFARPAVPGAQALVDAGALLREVAQLTAPRWRDGSEAEGRHISLLVEEETAGDGLYVTGQSSALREALTNLVFNAVDALPRGGTIRLVVGRKGDDVEIVVADTGTGMKPEVQARIFEPFFTTKGERGTGLGLAQVFGIVEQHGGRIDVESAPRRGTTIRILLPRARPSESDALAGGGAAVTERSCRVLVVDDEPALAHMAALMLAGGGHQVQTAASAEEALAQMEDGAYDAVVTDLGMGAGMNGWELAERVRNRWPRTRVVLATGWGARIDSDEARGRGVAAVLPKPYREADLLRAVAA